MALLGIDLEDLGDDLDCGEFDENDLLGLLEGSISIDDCVKIKDGVQKQNVYFEGKHINYFDIPELTQEEYSKTVRKLTLDMIDKLSCLKFKFVQYTMDHDKGVDKKDHVSAEYFDFFVNHTECFFYIRREKKYMDDPSCIGKYTVSVNACIRNPKWLKTLEVNNICKLLGLENSYCEFDRKVDPGKVLERYNTKNKYINLCELLDIRVNSSHCLKDEKMTVTMLNHVFRKYSMGLIDRKQIRIQENGKRVRVYENIYIKDPDKHFDETIIVK